MGMNACPGFILIACFLILPFLTSCEQTQVATPTPVTIVIAGATGMRPVLQALTSEFSRLHPSVIFDLRGGGSTIGEQLIANGEVDLAASVLPATENSETQGTPTSQKLFRVPIGIDGLAIVVHRSNPIVNLSLAQLRDLFSGRTVNWKELGGADDDILLVSREDGSGARHLFESRIMGIESVSLTAVVMPTSADVVDFVGKNPEAIGYVSRSYVASEIDQSEIAQSLVTQTEITQTETSPLPTVQKVAVVAVEGRLPTLAAVRDGSYLLSTPIFLVGQGELAGWNRQFVEFILGPVGQQIVEQYHARIR